jgi:hypothetical protein
MIRTGKVSSLNGGPISAIRREIDDRYRALMDANEVGDAKLLEQYRNECHGLAVALAVLTGNTVEAEARQAHDRYLGVLNTTAP